MRLFAAWVSDMQFASVKFAVFSAALLICYYRVPKGRQWQVLLTASMVFYLWAGLRYFFFLVFTAATSFGTALAMARNRDKGKKILQKYLMACLVLNFGLLFVCKIFLLLPGRDFLLPLGISFYMFQSMGYVLDVYRGKEAEGSFPKYLLFISYFPQLIQGPISKFSNLAPQLTTPHDYEKKTVSFGLQRMLWGYFKKLVIADRIAVAVTTLRNPEYTGFGFFLLTLFYAVQIYADFTGGIDIALGLSQALGITLPENFLRPSFSKNVAEYWRRWHITLGAWMREYIFFPISISKPLRKLSKSARKRFGNFGKRLPVYVASLVTWFATGIWHGLTPNFVLWGMLNYLVIVLSEELTPLYRKFHARVGWKSKSWYGCFEILRTFLLMNLIRACDLFPDVGEYFLRIGSLCSPWNLSILPELGLTGLDYGILVFGVTAMFTVSLIQEKKGSVREILWQSPTLGNGLCLFLFLTILLCGHYGVGYDAASFIYNQF